MNELFPSPAAGMFGRRLKRERGHRIPVTVITGFLGAGKTTLLRRFLGTPEGQGTAVVVNEFGATGIDDALVRSSTDETVLLGNGCLCCIARTDLQQALRRMVAPLGWKTARPEPISVGNENRSSSAPILRWSRRSASSNRWRCSANAFSDSHAVP